MQSETGVPILVRGPVAALLFGGWISSAQSLVRIWQWRGTLGQASEALRLPLMVLAAASLTMIGVALHGVVRRRTPEPRPLDLRLGVALLIVGTILYPAAVPSYSYSLAMFWWGTLAALYSLWLKTRPKMERPPSRRGRVLELVLFNLALTLFLLQVGLYLAAKLFPSSLLSVPGSAREFLEQSRCPPGTLRFGFPCNRRGYYDEEPKHVEGIQVSVVGDSFTLGILPHPLIFTTVAEHITGYRVDSFGVAGAGPLEYRIILHDDALSTQPDAVVVAVFVGNDIINSYLGHGRHQGQSTLRFWLDRNRNPVWIVAERLRRVLAELRAGRRLATLGEAQGVASPGAAYPTSEDEYPWTVDYRLEEPTYSRSTYLERELFGAMGICRPRERLTYSAFFEDLEALAEMSSKTRFAVMLIPDEFQVEDGLWREILERAEQRLDRDMAQRTIRSWLDARRIPYVDLLPVFRAFPVEEDGDRHLYHRQNSHLNARGDQVAGEQLALLLRRVLGFPAPGR